MSEELKEIYTATCRQIGCRNKDIVVTFIASAELSELPKVFCSPCNTYITEIELKNS
jgi:hypothetical protein